MHIGLIGLGTMGANLARNAARNGATVAVYNRTQDKLDSFMQAHSSEGDFVACTTYEDLHNALPAPRTVILMVKAGDAVDEVLKELLPHLEAGDIIIDAGNSHYRDTARREEALAKKAMRFVGMGVSGGEEGALKGPSMMPGGSKEAYDYLAPLLLPMAATDGEGGRCVSHIGPGGSGHFVKMVHNGIEYGIMQLIAEAYHLLKQEGEMSNAQIAELFEDWNRSDTLQSFLMEITVDILRKKDDITGEDLLDVILDTAGQKGTGKWTTDAAMHYGVAVPTITAAVDARIVSSAKEFRVKQSTSDALTTVAKEKVSHFGTKVQAALSLSVMNTYAQGFQLLSVASKDEGWNLNMSDIARIWRGGCIIRSVLLEQFEKMFTGDKEASAAMRARFAGEAQLQWREIVALGVLRGLPLPAHSASLTYFDAYRTARLPSNLIAAQRDFFGAHTYQRTDKEGTFHTQWNS